VSLNSEQRLSVAGKSTRFGQMSMPFAAKGAVMFV